MKAVETLEVVSSGATLGAEVRGLDLARPLSPAAVQVVHAALHEHLVLVFRGQDLSPPQLIAFAGQFGELLPAPVYTPVTPVGQPTYPEFPLLNRISNIIDAQGNAVGNGGSARLAWHQDMTYNNHPPKWIVLYGEEVPVGQGDTHFCNMAAAYEALDEGLRRRVEGLRLVHDAAHNSAGLLRRSFREVTSVRDTPGARHPMVYHDPESGRRILFLGRRAHAYVVGLEEAESEALLDELWHRAAQPRFSWTHAWRPGDVLMWHNFAVIHRRDPFDPAARRTLLRAQVMGDAP